MEVNIGEVNSTVRATDSASLLSPEVMERIVQRRDGARARGKAAR